MYYTVCLNILPMGNIVVLDIKASENILYLLNILYTVFLINLYLLNILYLLYTACLINPTPITLVLFMLLGLVAFLSKVLITYNFQSFT